MRVFLYCTIIYLILDECKTLRSEPKQAKQCTRLDTDLDGVTQSRL